MTLQEHREQLKGAFRASLSPPMWKDQLKQRCMQRLKQDRHKLLARLRRPDAPTSIADEMKRLVQTEERKEDREAASGRREPGRCHSVFDLHKDSQKEMENLLDADICMRGDVEQTSGQATLDANSSVDDLLYMGKLSQEGYMDLVHTLEDALREEVEREAGADDELLAQQMIDFEDASLEAMLAGMDLEDLGPGAEFPAEANAMEEAASPDVYVLCPTCKSNLLREETSSTPPLIACDCGFTFRVKYVYHGILKDFQDQIGSAFMTHRDACFSDPTFSKCPAEVSATGMDVLRMTCHDCGCNRALP